MPNNQRIIFLLSAVLILANLILCACTASASDRIVDQYGEPVAGAEVRLEVVAADDSGAHVLTVTTDERGCFEEGGLGGSYRVTAIQKPGYRLTSGSGAQLAAAYRERLKKIRERQEIQRTEREAAETPVHPDQARKMAQEPPVYAADYSARMAQAEPTRLVQADPQRSQPVDWVVYRQLEPTDLVYKTQEYAVSIHDTDSHISYLDQGSLMFSG